MAKRAELKFKVAEFKDDQQLYIVMEAFYGAEMEIFKGRCIGFDLPPGTTLEEANQIADYLQRHLLRVIEW